MIVADVMNTEPIVVTPETPVQEIARQLWRHGISGVPVVNAAGELVSGGVGIAVHLGSIPNAVGSLPASLRSLMVSSSTWAFSTITCPSPSPVSAWRLQDIGRSCARTT